MFSRCVLAFVCLGVISCSAGSGAAGQDADQADLPFDVPADPAVDEVPVDGDIPADGTDGADPPVEADMPADDSPGDPDADLEDGMCPSVPAPDPVPLSALPGESPAGRHETTTVNGFQDDYIYDSTDYLKIGVRREWGATVIFFGMAGSGPGVNGTNSIDANDTGREVQVAFYDPDRIMQNCAWNASCAATPTTCPNSITYLGWNPVQGGNRCNVGSGVESVNFADGVLEASVNPLFWNPNWDRTDCSSAACDDPALRARRSDVRVIQKLRFVRTHVVELDYTLINLSDLDHRATSQEMPTVYTANGHGGPDLWRLFNSEGVEIPIDTFAGGDGFYYENFESPGGWATMQNDGADYGVGLYAESRLASWQAWQLRSLPFNNFRPLPSFAVPALGVVRARVYLILGAYGTVAAEAAWLDQNLAPFGVLDAPAEDETLSGTAALYGWALDNKGVTSVEALVDGELTVPLTYGGARPDVCLVWPHYAGCDNVGYSGSLDTSLLTACGHIVEIRATDADGNTRVIARRRVFVE
jgi:hypothetical protein